MLFKRTIDHSAYAVTKNDDVEVNDKADYATGELEIRKQLGLVNRQYLVNRLEFNNDGIFDQQINPITAVNVYAPIDQRKGLLSLHRQALFSQFKSEARLIRGFQESGSKLAMNPNSRPDNLLRQLVDLIHPSFPTVSSVLSVVHIPV